MKNNENRCLMCCFALKLCGTFFLWHWLRTTLRRNFELNVQTRKCSFFKCIRNNNRSFYQHKVEYHVSVCVDVFWKKGKRFSFWFVSDFWYDFVFFFAFCCVNFQLCPCRVLLLGYVWTFFWRWSAKNADSCIFCRLQRGPSTTINSYVFANDS